MSNQIKLMHFIEQVTECAGFIYTKTNNNNAHIKNNRIKHCANDIKCETRHYHCLFYQY